MSGSLHKLIPDIIPASSRMKENFGSDMVFPDEYNMDYFRIPSKSSLNTLLHLETIINGLTELAKPNDFLHSSL